MLHFSIKKLAYSEIEEKYRCAHEKRETRLRIIADGRKAYYSQCVRCGHAGNAISSKSAIKQMEFSAQALFDNELEHQWRARKSVEYKIKYQEIEPSLKKEYEAYLDSETWKKRRANILERANNICECCEHYPATEVHHKTYARIGEELDNDLMAVCNFCHSLIHGKI